MDHAQLNTGEKDSLCTLEVISQLSASMRTKFLLKKAKRVSQQSPNVLSVALTCHLSKSHFLFQKKKDGVHPSNTNLAER